MEQCISKENLNSYMTVVLRPPGKIGQIELKMDQSDLFLTGGWPQFLASHGITDANALLLKYEGNMVCTVKVFEHDGCQRGSRNKDIRMEQGEQKINRCIIFLILSSELMNYMFGLLYITRYGRAAICLHTEMWQGQRKESKRAHDSFEQGNITEEICL